MINATININNLNNRYWSTELLWPLGLIVSIIIGFLIRVNGIGNAPLAVDEYYIVKSVENILKHGLPQFDSGGYYTRGIVYQYLLAFISLLWDARIEFSYRLLTILINLLAIHPLFQLARKAGGKTVAYMVALLFCFSLWEIEFSRFIRMYAFFQTMFLWYLYFLYLVVIERKYHYLKWAYFLSFLSIFVYEGNIFLVVLNFLPFLLVRETVRKSNIFVSLLLLCLAYAFHVIDFRHMGASDYYPTGVMPEGGSDFPILIPVLLITTFQFPDVWSILFVIPLIASGYVLFTLYKDRQLTVTSKLSFSIIIILSLFNLFGLLLVLSVVMVLMGWIKVREIQLRKQFAVWGILLVNFLFWVLYLFLSSHWIHFFENVQSGVIRSAVISQLQLNQLHQLSSVFSLKKAILLLFNYPYFYKKIFYQYFSAMPGFTIFAFLSIFLIVGISIFTDRKNFRGISGERFLLAILIITGIGVATLNTTYNSTRYTFFVFPLFLMILVILFYRITDRFPFPKGLRSSLLLILVGLFVIVSEDYNFRHLFYSGSTEVHLRMNYDEDRAGHFYSREDTRTPAQIINKFSDEDDLVIITLLHIEHYLKKVDYIYIDYRSLNFKLLSTYEGTREIWTNAKLIFEPNTLFELIEKSKNTLWLAIYSDKTKQKPIDKEISERFKKNIFYRSLDDKINVYRIEK